MRRKSCALSRAVPLDRAGSPDPAKPDLGVGLRVLGAAPHKPPHYRSASRPNRNWLCSAASKSLTIQVKPWKMALFRKIRCRARSRPGSVHGQQAGGSRRSAAGRRGHPATADLALFEVSQLIDLKPRPSENWLCLVKIHHRAKINFGYFQGRRSGQGRPPGPPPDWLCLESLNPLIQNPDHLRIGFVSSTLGPSGELGPAAEWIGARVPGQTQGCIEFRCCAARILPPWFSAVPCPLLVE